MKVHHLNCGSMCPHGKRLMQGQGGWLEQTCLVCHVLLVESRNGLVLVDTGIGTRECADPARMGKAFSIAARPRFDFSETALHQVQALGFSPRDVRHIVVTHLDLDHAGGLPDFPDAEVHIYGAELDAAMVRKTYAEKRRYLPIQWAHNPRWVRHETSGEKWLGFDAVRALPGCDDDVLIVPAAGHTRGHSVIAVKRDDDWLLHCGDAYFWHDEMGADAYCPPGLKFFQRMMAVDDRQRVHNQQRLRELALSQRNNVTLFCAHDENEFQSLSAGNISRHWPASAARTESSPA